MKKLIVVGIVAFLLGLGGKPFITEVVYASKAVIVGDLTDHVNITPGFITLENDKYPDYRFMMGVDEFGLFIIRQSTKDGSDFEIVQRWK